tara:strand:+ start:1022 stop:1279 length:258 start_codon:yes stop_codon:yes gene_type:complete
MDTKRGKYIIAKALMYATRYFDPSDESREMATVLTKYFPQFPELLKTNIIDDVILDKPNNEDLTFWEAMAEVAWSASDDKYAGRD